MIASLFSPVLASENTQATINDNSVMLITPDAFGAVFSTQDGVSTASFSAGIDEVMYSYTFEEREDEPNLADATVNFTVKIGEQSYPMSASGAVDAYALDSGETLWEGLLRGNTTINGGNFKILVGFAKLSSSDDIQVSVTVQNIDSEKTIMPVAFTFGDQVITVDILDEITSNSVVVDSNDVSEYAENMLRSGSFANLGQDYADFESSLISGYSQRARGYFNSTTNQFAVTIKSYCENVDDYYSATGTCETVLKSFRSKLTRNSYTSSSYSWISGIEWFDFNSDSSGAVSIKPLFDDIMGLLGVPTSTISSLFNGLKGTVTYNDASNNAYVDVAFGTTQNANFDDSSCGVPIVFQLDRNNSGYTGSSSYKFTTSIVYRTTIVPTGTTTGSILYTDGEDAYKTVSVTLG